MKIISICKIHGIKWRFRIGVTKPARLAEGEGVEEGHGFLFIPRFVFNKLKCFL